MENSKTERLAYIDVARGFVIILMLIGPDSYIIKQNGPNSVSKNSQYPNLKLT